jgi:hypothetical protein
MSPFLRACTGLSRIRTCSRLSCRRAAPRQRGIDRLCAAATAAAAPPSIAQAPLSNTPLPVSGPSGHLRSPVINTSEHRTVRGPWVIPCARPMTSWYKAWAHAPLCTIASSSCTPSPSSPPSSPRSRLPFSPRAARSHSRAERTSAATSTPAKRARARSTMARTRLATTPTSSARALAPALATRTQARSMALRYGCFASSSHSSMLRDEQCFCDNWLNTTTASDSDCHYACAGNNAETCGGDWRLTVYSTGAGSGTGTGSGSGTGTGSSGSPTSSTTAPVSTPTAPSGAGFLGCYMDNASSGAPRSLNFGAYQNSDNTNELCQSTCAGLGYAYSGTEYGEQVRSLVLSFGVPS